MAELTDEEYKEALRNIIQSAIDLDQRKTDIKKLEAKIYEIEQKTYEYLIDGLDPLKRGFSENDRDKDKYYYNVSFRIDEPTQAMPKTIGFFFDVNEFCIGTRVADYDNLYHSSTLGYQCIYLFMDFAEDIIDRAKARMKLSKYNSKYDLSYLIDTMYTLSTIRGDKYFVREGTPPEKDLPGTDRMTGKEKVVRGSSSKLNVGFKILSVTSEE